MRIVDINGEVRECAGVAVDKDFPGYMKVEFVSVNRKGHKYSEWYPIGEFIKNNPDLAELAGKARPVVEEALGVVDEAGDDFVVDRDKKWEKDVYQGFPMWIARGKGEGQTRVVKGNGTNTVFLEENWEVVPDKTSQYVISYNVHDPQVLGNTLSETGEEDTIGAAGAGDQVLREGKKGSSKC